MQWAEWAVATAWRHGRPEAWLGMSGLKSDAEMSIVSVCVFRAMSLDSLFNDNGCSISLHN